MCGSTEQLWLNCHVSGGKGQSLVQSPTSIVLYILLYLLHTVVTAQPWTIYASFRGSHIRVTYAYYICKLCVICCLVTEVPGRLPSPEVVSCQASL